jgi:hypothetical protein
MHLDKFKTLLLDHPALNGNLTALERIKRERGFSRI